MIDLKNRIRSFFHPNDRFTPEYVNQLVAHTEEVAEFSRVADQELTHEVISNHPDTELAFVLLRARERQQVPST